MTVTHVPATLLGTGIGDALGCPFEVAGSMPHFHPKLADWKGDYLSTRGGWHDLEPGQWSDDTQMSVALAEAILAAREDNGRAFTVRAAKNYLALFQDVGIRGVGGTTRKAMQALASGATEVTSGIEGAEGNGTAMRAAPIGLAFRGKTPGVVAGLARLEAKTTHRSLEAEEGSAAVAVLVQALANTSRVPRVGVGGKIDALSTVISVLRESRIEKRLGELYLAWLKQSSPGTLHRFLAVFGTRGHVVETVPSAVACFLFTEDYEGAVLAAIRAGGDTDTTAAITGALAGTFYGREGIPERLAVGVDQRERLQELDQRLFEAGGSPS